MYVAQHQTHGYFLKTVPNASLYFLCVFPLGVIIKKQEHVVSIRNVMEKSVWCEKARVSLNMKLNYFIKLHFVYCDFGKRKSHEQ